MLNLMMTTMVWLLSMGFFQFSWIHHTFQHTFSLLTPTLMESMIVITFADDTWKVGFDENLVSSSLPIYVAANLDHLYTTYDLSFTLKDYEQPCVTYCNFLEIELVYVNGGKEWTLKRSFQIYGV